MPLQLTTQQRALLRAENLRARLLTTWHMDDGTYRYTENIDDITIGTKTWIGASAIASCSDIVSPAGLSSESVTLEIDGTRLIDAGLDDPAALFQMILAVPHSNRPVEISLALGRSDQDLFEMELPLLSGLINHMKVVDPTVSRSGGLKAEPVVPKLSIVIDTIAQRYSWVTGRLRTHEDQLDIDPTDKFFEFVHGNMVNESKMYWGRKAPTSSGGGGGGGGAGGGYGGHYDYDYNIR